LPVDQYTIEHILRHRTEVARELAHLTHKIFDARIGDRRLGRMGLNASYTALGISPVLTVSECRMKPSKSLL
jgi:hypothetical protein